MSKGNINTSNALAALVAAATDDTTTIATMAGGAGSTTNITTISRIRNNSNGSSNNNMYYASGLNTDGTCQFHGVIISEMTNERKLEFNTSNKFKGGCTLLCSYDSQGILLKISLDDTQDDATQNALKEYLLCADTEAAQLGRLTYAISLENDNMLLRFANEQDLHKFRKLLDYVKHLRPKSVFSQRTEESSASQYFQFYGYLSQQQNMMQDYVRTSTYQRAILSNSIDFHVS